MGTAQRQTNTDLELPEVQHVGGDDFHQLVRTLERLRAYAERNMNAAVGFDGPAADEAVRFKAAQHAAFPAHPVERITPIEADNASGQRHEMTVNFMGLTGPTGVLPAHYTGLVQARLKQRDDALADFLDLFNHRLTSLFHRAWAKYRPVIQYEQHYYSDTTDPFSRALQALSGQLRNARSDVRLYYSGHFSRYTRSATTLRRLLSDYLGHDVEVESFVGQWLAVAQEDRLRIGSGNYGENNHLGSGVLPGKRVWDVQSKARIHVGPLTQAEHAQLLPGTEQFKAFRRLIEEYVPGHMNIEIKYHIKDPQKRSQPLGRQLRLGRNSWAQAQPAQERYATVQLRPSHA